MLYLKAPNQTREFEPLASWGAFTRYMEIGDDLNAVRHVDVFANGNSLSYDRSHWVDELGMLADKRYDRKKWKKYWGTDIEIHPEEFEAIWSAAACSSARCIQLSGERMSKMGEIPIWIMKLKDKHDEP